MTFFLSWKIIIRFQSCNKVSSSPNFHLFALSKRKRKGSQIFSRITPRLSGLFYYFCHFPSDVTNFPRFSRTHTLPVAMVINNTFGQTHSKQNLLFPVSFYFPSLTQFITLQTYTHMYAYTHTHRNSSATVILPGAHILREEKIEKVRSVEHDEGDSLKGSG